MGKFFILLDKILVLSIKHSPTTVQHLVVAKKKKPLKKNNFQTDWFL